MGGTIAIHTPVQPSDEIVITRGGAGVFYWTDMWRHRELLYYLVWRDILIRYKQTVVGIAWALLRPLVATFVMVIVFGKLAGLGIDGLPYSLGVLTGLLSWQLFAGAVGGVAQVVQEYLGSFQGEAPAGVEQAIVARASVMVNVHQAV